MGGPKKPSGQAPERYEGLAESICSPMGTQNPTIPFSLSLPPYVSKAFLRLCDAGHETHIVGGALRDTLLERPVTDWDISTSATAEEIRSLFTDTTNYQLKNETVALVIEGRRLEITPFRGPERTILGDLARRDFTINALAHDPVQKTLIDPWEGKRDLARRIVRGTGDPGLRFEEDPIRLLRGVRLAAELNFRIEPDTRSVMQRMAHSISYASWERIRDELLKILLLERPSTGFNLLMQTELLSHVLPELLEGKDMAQNPYHRFTVFDHIMETLDRVPAVIDLRLAALLHDIGKPRVRSYDDDQWRFYGHEEAGATLCEEIMERLRLSRSLIKSVSRLVRYHMLTYTPEWGDGAIRRLLRKVGTEHIADLLTLRRADLDAHGTGPNRTASLDALEDRVRSLGRERTFTALGHLAVDGHTVMKTLKLKSGPMVGRYLNELLEMVTDRPGLNNEKDLVEILLRMKGD